MALVSVTSLVLLQTAWSLTRFRRISPDSMNYINVAANIVSGRGLVQDTVGYGENRFPAGARFPQPFGVHGPLYPLLIAAMGLLDIPLSDAALLISGLSYGAILALAFALMERLYDRSAALWALLLLLLSYPLHEAACAAWSENPSLALAMLSTLLIARPPQAVGAVRAGLAGLLAGLAFAGRYPLLVALPIGVVALMERQAAAASVRRVIAYALGFAGVFVPVVARNVVVTGHLAGAGRNQSTVSLAENLREAALILVGQLFTETGRRDPWAYTHYKELLQAALLLLSLLVAVHRARHRGELGWRARFLGDGRILLPLWIAIYTSFVVVQRSIINFDPLNARMLLPAHVFLLALWAMVLAAGFPQLRTPALSLALACVVTLRAAPLIMSLLHEQPANDRRVVRRSPRLTWVQNATSDADLLISEGSQDLMFYLGRRSLYLTAYPHMQPLDHQQLAHVVLEACPRYRNIYLLLGVHTSWAEADYQRRFGPFVTDLAQGRLRGYPEIELVKRLEDGTVFRLDCKSLSGAAREIAPR